MKKQKPTVQLNVRISSALHAQLEKIAKSAGIDKQSLVSGTLKQYAELFAEGVGR